MQNYEYEISIHAVEFSLSQLDFELIHILSTVIHLDNNLACIHQN